MTEPGLLCAMLRAGISTTIERIVPFNVALTKPLCDSKFRVDRTVQFSTNVTGGLGPFQYNWPADVGASTSNGSALVPATQFGVVSVAWSRRLEM